MPHRPQKIGPLKQAALHQGCVFVALWQSNVVRFLVFMLIIGAMLIIVSGCGSVPATANRPAIDGKPLILAHEGKDRAIVDWAGKIDARLDDLAAGRADLAAVAADIKAATAAQRAEVAKAPASQFNVIIDALQRNAKEDAKAIAELRDALAKEKDRFFFWMRLLLTGGGSIVMAASVAAFIFLGQLAAIFPSIGKRVIGGVFAFGATLFAAGIAYAWAYHHQTLLACIAGAILIFVATGIYFNKAHDKADKRLA